MPPVDSPVFDADNHYYEALDAFTRHLDPAARAPGDRVGRGRRPAATTRWAAGSAGPSPTRPSTRSRRPARWSTTSGATPTAAPCTSSWGRPSPSAPSTATATPAWPAWTPRAWPRSGCSRPSACSTRRRSRTTPGRSSCSSVPSTAGWPRTGAWRTGTGSSPPPTSLWPTWTRPCASSSGRSTRCPDRRACGPPPRSTVHGPLSPAADVFDPFWARVNEAGITVVVHAGDAGLSSNGYAVDGFSASFRAGPVASEHQDVRH